MGRFVEGQEGDVLGHLVEDIMEDVENEEYNPDEFLEESKDHLSAYGYDVAAEMISEFKEDEQQELDGDHLEVIAGLTDEEGHRYLRFILEEGRPTKRAPSVEIVGNPRDFDYEPSGLY